MDEIIKVVAFAFIALFIVLIFKDKREDISLMVSIVVGALIFLFMFSKLTTVINLLEQLALKANIDYIYLSIIFKILGIAYLSSFCSEICKDAGQGNIASKVEFSGKILILVLAMPILMGVLQSILKIL